MSLPEQEHILCSLEEYEEPNYDDSPISYSALIHNETTPLLQDFDPPPDYTDHGAFEELPTYQQVQEESGSSPNWEDRGDYLSFFFFLIILGVIAMVTSNPDIS